MFSFTNIKILFECTNRKKNDSRSNNESSFVFFSRLSVVDPFFEFISASDLILYNEPLRRMIHSRPEREREKKIIVFKTMNEVKQIRINRTHLDQLPVHCFHRRLNKTIVEIALNNKTKLKKQKKKCCKQFVGCFVECIFIAKRNQRISLVCIPFATAITIEYMLP